MDPRRITPDPGTPTTHPTAPFTTPQNEVHARILLAQHGAGGGLKAHRTAEGWMFAPFLHGEVTDTWLVTDDGDVINLVPPAIRY